MYETRGPCCDLHEEIQNKVKAMVKVGHTMLQGNPRLMLKWGKSMEEQIGSFKMREGLSDDPCPCNEAPDPQKFRAFARFVMDKKTEGVKVSNPVKAGVIISALAEEFVKISSR